MYFGMFLIVFGEAMKQHKNLSKEQITIEPTIFSRRFNCQFRSINSSGEVFRPSSGIRCWGPCHGLEKFFG